MFPTFIILLIPNSKDRCCCALSIRYNNQTNAYKFIKFQSYFNLYSLSCNCGKRIIYVLIFKDIYNNITACLHYLQSLIFGKKTKMCIKAISQFIYHPFWRNISISNIIYFFMNLNIFDPLLNTLYLPVTHDSYFNCNATLIFPISVQQGYFCSYTLPSLYIYFSVLNNHF